MIARKNGTKIWHGFRPLECPVCGYGCESDEEVSSHVEECLRTAQPPPGT